MKRVALLSMVLLSGCASILEGSTQDISVNTNPSGATCTIDRNGENLGTISPTPGTLRVEKTKYDITIKCNKEGYLEAIYHNKSGTAGATVGNIVAGGLIGWGVDSATGSDNKYESPITITLPR